MAEPAGTPAPASTPAATRPPAFATFTPAGRMIIIGAGVLVVALVIGLVVGAWQLNPFGLALILTGLVAAGATWADEGMSVPDGTARSFPAIQLATGAIATALSLLAVLEMIGDIDDMEDFGGPIGLVLGIVILAASAAVLWGALRRTSPDLRGAEPGARIAGLGALFVLVAWALHVTIGFWSLGPATWGIMAVVLAAALVLVGSSGTLPAWISWVAVVLGLFAAWTAFGQWGALMDIGADRVELGLEDYLPFLLYVAGILLVILGAAMSAIRATPAVGAAVAEVAGRGSKDGDDPA